MAKRAKPLGINRNYVTKGGLKLEFALQHFAVDVQGKLVGDLGSHQGGFVDCLLTRGARRVYAVDTCYGTLAWKIRKDPRVVVCERTNALYWKSPEMLDFISIDVGWTRQYLILPAALANLKKDGTILSLLKPQYEAGFNRTKKGILLPEQVEEVLMKTLDDLKGKFEVISYVLSPYQGSGGNQEIWLYLQKPI